MASLNKFTIQIWFFHYHWECRNKKKKWNAYFFVDLFLPRQLPRLPQWKLRHCHTNQFINRGRNGLTSKIIILRRLQQCSAQVCTNLWSKTEYTCIYQHMKWTTNPFSVLTRGPMKPVIGHLLRSSKATGNPYSQFLAQTPWKLK